MSRTESSKFVSSKARAASRRQPTKRIIFFNFAKEVGSPSAVDRTDYGTASGSARGFAQHHSQQLSRAAVCGDAQNINNAARNMRVAHSFMTGLNVPPPCARAF